MRILHAIQGLPIAAGTTTFVVGVANEMARMGHEVTVAVYCEPTDGDKALFDDAVRVVSIPSVLRIRNGNNHFDLVHIHAMWNIWLHRVAVWCRRNRVPYVCSPHGSVTSWALNYKRLKKRVMWFLYQRRDFACATALHATAAAERGDIKRLGLERPVIIAPLGVLICSSKEASAGRNGGLVFLFVGRVHKTKGLENLIRAVADLQRKSNLPCGANAPVFRIVGPDQNGYVSELAELAESLGVQDMIRFVGPKYGADLCAEYAGADVFVLPSLSENFAVVVADALANGMPVITTRGAPWRELEEFRCGWWVDVGVGPLAEVLASVMEMSRDELSSMGAAGRKLVMARYSWSVVAQKLLDGYCHILDDSPDRLVP